MADIIRRCVSCSKNYVRGVSSELVSAVPPPFCSDDVPSPDVVCVVGKGCTLNRLLLRGRALPDHTDLLSCELSLSVIVDLQQLLLSVQHYYN